MLDGQAMTKRTKSRLRHYLYPIFGVATALCDSEINEKRRRLSPDLKHAICVKCEAKLAKMRRLDGGRCD